MQNSIRHKLIMLIDILQHFTTYVKRIVKNKYLEIA